MNTKTNTAQQGDGELPPLHNFSVDDEFARRLDVLFKAQKDYDGGSAQPITAAILEINSYIHAHMRQHTRAALAQRAGSGEAVAWCDESKSLLCWAEGHPKRQVEGRNQLYSAPPAAVQPDSGRDAALQIAVAALGAVSQWHFGWDGDCGVSKAADDALVQIEAALAAQPTENAAVQSLTDAEIRKVAAQFLDDGSGFFKRPTIDDVKAYTRAILAAASAKGGAK